MADTVTSAERPNPVAISGQEETMSGTTDITKKMKKQESETVREATTKYVPEKSTGREPTQQEHKVLDQSEGLRQSKSHRLAQLS